MVAFQQCIHDTWKHIIDPDMGKYIEDGCNFNSKINLMQHFEKQLQQYRLLEQWSTEITESSHQKQIKDGLNASNKTSEYYT